MEFWLIAGVVTALVAASLALAALVRRQAPGAAGNDMQVYRDQLQEVGRDSARGVLSDAEAEQVRLEVSRRLLEADRDLQQAPVTKEAHTSPVLAVAIVATLFGGTFLLYGQLGSPAKRDLPLNVRLAASEATRLNRPPQSEIEAQVPVAQASQAADPAHLELIEKLREALKSRPNDLQGHVLLARNEAGLGNFIAAHKAQRRVLEIKGDAATAEDFANYADLLALAANGYVSPEAERALNRTLQLDPSNGAGRFYLGLLEAQNGRADRAFGVWRQLLEESPPSAPWVPPIRAQIGMVAADAGVRYQLPPLSSVSPGPDAADIAAAQDMSPEEQAQLIQGMVQQLSSRLAAQGGPAQDWARLIGALGVLGETEQATAIWQEAQVVFAESPQDLAIIHEAAGRIGVAN